MNDIDAVPQEVIPILEAIRDNNISDETIWQCLDTSDKLWDNYLTLRIIGGCSNVLFAEQLRDYAINFAIEDFPSFDFLGGNKNDDNVR
jgi:hypothetical protein